MFEVLFRHYVLVLFLLYHIFLSLIPHFRHKDTDFCTIVAQKVISEIYINHMKLGASRGAIGASIFIITFTA